MEYKDTGLPDNEMLQSCFDICSGQDFFNAMEYREFINESLKLLTEYGADIEPDFMSAAMLAMVFPKQFAAQRDQVASELGGNVTSYLAAIDASDQGGRFVVDDTNSQLKQFAVAVGMMGYKVIENGLREAQANNDTLNRKIELEVSEEMFKEMCEQHIPSLPTGAPKLDALFDEKRIATGRLLYQKKKEWSGDIKAYSQKSGLGRLGAFKKKFGS